MVVTLYESWLLTPAQSARLWSYYVAFHTRLEF